MTHFRTLAIFGLALLVLLPAGAFGQDRSIFDAARREEERPKSFLESLEKMRIDKEKKEFDEMMGRADQVRTLATEIERSFTAAGALSAADRAKAATVEKLARKVRGELGGGDDDEEDEDAAKTAVPEATLTPSGNARALKAAADVLCDELKKTSRFSISASAIRSTNVVIRLARSLRGAK